MVAAMRTALTIAGSDSGGGAGIQADIKSFAAVGVHGTSVVTCVTAQNTRAVASIFPLPVEEVRSQLRAVLDDFDVRAAKTGMLYSADIVTAVAEELRGTDLPLVVDPVMVATVGARLERDDFRDALVERLLGRADLVTPNRHEAERLAGFPVLDIADMEKAAREIHALGARAVLVKGGHVAGELVDVLYDGRGIRRLRSFRYAKELHGAGCTLAASIAAYLVLGRSMRAAVDAARRRVAAGFLASYRAGKGVEIINSHVRPQRYEVVRALADAGPGLSRAVPPRLRPKGGVRLTYALPGATAPADLAIWSARGRMPDFGAPGDLARIPLAVLHVNPTLRAAATLKYPAKNAGHLASAGLVVAALRRGPGSLRIKRAIVETGAVPDVLVDAREGARTATMHVLGETPEQVVRKVRRLLRGGIR